jgi:phage gpG-like protein
MDIDKPDTSAEDAATAESTTTTAAATNPKKKKKSSNNPSASSETASLHPDMALAQDIHRLTMVQNGKLMKSLMNLNDRSANSISDMNAEFGTSVEYAKFHQYGTSKMPKRQVVYVPVEFSHDLASKMAKYIVQQGYDFR